MRDYGLDSRIALIRSDLFADLGGRTYDLILAHPPYVDSEALVAFPPEYAAERQLAHAGKGWIGSGPLILARSCIAFE